MTGMMNNNTTQHVMNFSCKSLDHIPPLTHMVGTKTLDVSFNRINLSQSDIDNLPPNLEKLIISSNSINCLNSSLVFPESLKEIDMSSNNFIVFNGDFLKHVTTLNVKQCSIRQFLSYPPKIEHLNLSFNMIKSVPMLPRTLKYFNISNNDLVALPFIANPIDEVDVSHNCIREEPRAVDMNYVTKMHIAFNPFNQLKSLPPINTHYNNTHFNPYYNNPNYNNMNYQSNHLYRNNYRKTGVYLNDLSVRKHYIL